MVGLSIVLDLESQSYSNNNSVTNNTFDCSTKKVITCSSSQVINKATMIINQKPPSHHQTLPFATTFLDHCSLCHQKLLPGKDIYMYKGDRAFCSVECRCRQIFMDEEETKSVHKDMCSFSAMKPSSSSSSSSSSSRPRKGSRNRAL